MVKKAWGRGGVLSHPVVKTVKTPSCNAGGVQVRSLAGELKAHVPQGKVKLKQKQQSGLRHEERRLETEER